MAGGIKVGLLTQASGPHLSAYLPALAEAPLCESVVLCDASGRWEEDARKALGPKLKKVYLDHASLLKEEQPQMCLISMEALSSPPVIAAALEANCHVLAEKPSCVRVEDFAPLVTKAEMKHRHLLLALANRIHPAVVEARRIVQSGAIGRIYGVEAHLIADHTRTMSASYPKSWFAQKAKAGGGHLIWLGIHWIDLTTFITDSKIQEVAAFTGNVGGAPIDVEDSSAVLMKYDNGSFGTLTSGYYLDKGYHSHIKIWGEHGWVLVRPKDKTSVTWYSTRESKSAETQHFNGPNEPSGYSPFVADVVKACATDGQPPLNAADSLRVLQTVFACYRAAETGQTQKVG